MKNTKYVIFSLLIVPFFSGCALKAETVQDVFPITNECQEDADCRLVSPVLECSFYKCGSCGTEVIDNSDYVSVNSQNFAKYRSSYLDEECSLDLSDMLSCPDCITNYEYTVDINSKCIKNICVRR